MKIVVYIDTIFCGSPTYTNDMSLIAPDDSELQSMLDIPVIMLFDGNIPSMLLNLKSWFLDSLVLQTVVTGI